MRLGGPVFKKFQTPDEWVKCILDLGYRAAYCPVDSNAGDEEIKAYASAAQNADIIIAEVGAWSNPLSRDEKERKAAIEYCQKQLDLADRIGARCCVNISGSRGEQWDGPHPDNLTPETFDMVVETTRTIIDAVKPTRTFYTLEPMPWAFPDSADSYLKLIHAIDRPGFAVHLDPINMICSPHRFFNNSEFLKECFKKLGPYIRSCHAKDIRLTGKLTVHLEEVRPGLGSFDYLTYLKELQKIDRDTPLMIEHLPSEEEYTLAAKYIRDVARELGAQL